MPTKKKPASKQPTRKKEVVDPARVAARSAFDSFAQGSSAIALAKLPDLLAAIGHPEELEDARSVISYVKRFYFDCAPEDQLAWVEVERFLDSARPSRASR